MHVNISELFIQHSILLYTEYCDIIETILKLTKPFNILALLRRSV